MAAVTIGNNQHVLATVKGYDSANNEVPVNGNINWSNQNNAVTNQVPVGVGDPQTVVTGVGPTGVSNLMVTNGMFSDSAPVTVTAGPLARIAITFAAPIDN